MTGICDFFAMAGSASASSVSGTATRTIWQPEAVSSAICWRVALMSAVIVVVIDCTRHRVVAADTDAAHVELAGLAPGREHRRGCAACRDRWSIAMPVLEDLTPPVSDSREALAGRAVTRPGVSYNPRLIGLTMSATMTSSADSAMNSRRDHVADRHQPGDVERARVGAAAQPRDRFLTAFSTAPPATCPPSSGRIGSRLNRNSDRFTPASSLRKSEHLVRHGALLLEHLAGDDRPTPTSRPGR